MKHLIIFPSIFATGGVSVVGVLNTSAGSNAQHGVNRKASNMEISDKNISEIRSIEQLKKDNAIENIAPVEVPVLENTNTTFSAYHSSKIFVVDTTSDINTETSLITGRQSLLKDVLLKQIQLAHQKQVYTEVQSHINSNPPTTNTWEIATKSGTNDCEIKKSTTPKVSTSPVDRCSYDWNISFISVKDKIKSILSDTTVTTIPEGLKAKFDKITSTN